MPIFGARLRAALCLLVLLAGGLLLLAVPAGAQSYSPVIPFPSACGSCQLNGSDRVSDSGWTLNMQTDGNLVFRNSTGRACFASNTSGHSGSRANYQSDGNFVVYSSGGTALWASGTVGMIGSGYSVSIGGGQFYVGTKFIHGPC